MKAFKLCFCFTIAILLGCFAVLAEEVEMPKALIFKFDDLETITSFANGAVNTDISFENSTMKAVIKNGDSYITHRFTEDNTYADDYRYVKYRFKTTASPSMYCMEFYYKTPSIPTMGTANTYCRMPIGNTDDWQIKYADMKQVGRDLWSGKLEVFRIDPLEAHDRTIFNNGDVVYIDYVALFATKAEAEAYNGETAEEWVCPEWVVPEEISSADNQERIVWEFDSEEEIKKWSVGAVGSNNNTMQIVGFSNGILGVWDDDDNFNMQYTLPEEEQFTLEKFPYVKIRYKQSMANDSLMQWYFWNNVQSGNPYYHLNAVNADNWKTEIIDFSSGTAPGMQGGFEWKGTLTKFRFDPMRFKRGIMRQCYIDYIGFFKTLDDAQKYASDRSTEFGGGSPIILFSATQRAVVKRDTTDFFNAYDYMVPHEKSKNVSDKTVVKRTVNGVSSIVPLSFYNGKGISYSANTAGTYSFEDVDYSFGDINGHWAEYAINSSAKNGLFNGTDVNEFSPDLVLTRGMFITVIGRFAEVDASKYADKSYYSDVNPNEYYAPYINWAYENGIVADKNEFRPEHAMLRYEMALVINNFIKSGVYLFEMLENTTPDFADVSSLDVVYREAIKNVAKMGIINGKDNSLFDPSGMLTRAEAATVLHRLTKSAVFATSLRDYVRYDMEEMMLPLWKGNKVYHESFLPVREVEGEEIEIQLMYDIDSVISLNNSFLDQKYVYGKDFTVRDGKLYIPADSSIVCMSNEEYNPIFGSYINITSGGYIFTGGDGIMHSKQCAITYTHSDTWEGDYYPTENPDKLKKIKAKLRNGEDVTIALFGDSISTGCDSSGLERINLPPFLPKFIDLAAEALEAKYNNNVTVINRSKGGMYTSWADENVTSLFKDDKFDLFIIAYGMNDGTLKVDGAEYQKYIRGIMDKVLAMNPECEFILISTTLPNADSTFMKYVSEGVSYHESYEPLLQELADEYGENTDLFKLTSMHKHILTRKLFRDATSSNINHPNDFIIRFYAQGIFELLNQED
ncbi:MAG: S-layer homology domain-containing protein [Clostridia bacterium]|nr:S-layer homology domain-containing protein [Clostridia bacterium]